MNHSRSFQLAALVSLVLSTAATLPGSALAGPGKVCLETAIALAACPADQVVDTYYANSPVLRKFVDTLPQLMSPNDTAAATTPHIPMAVADTTSFPGSDYYVMGVVEYEQRLHSDLPKATTLRGYVQLYPQGTASGARGPNAQALTYPDGSPIVWPGTTEQVWGFEKPHYLGPVIVTNRDHAVRMLMMNFLPTGRFDAVTGKRNGDLFLPVDESLGGAGETPTNATDGTYTQNRVTIHLHGGDSPWISDGTPHQWFAPAGEPSPYKKGASLKPVPDMPAPTAGGETLYWPNNQTARFMWFHDHTFGLTRQNAYGGMVAGYVIADPTEDAALGITGFPMLPLFIQDKTFVPTNVATQDAKWDTLHWGKPGDLWMPHVYEVNEVDTANGPTENPAGRWDYGPQDPTVVSQPAFARPDGSVAQPSTTPEMYNDTPVVNGVAYPTVTVEPRAYRVRFLNGSNDRYLNLSLYQADPSYAVGTDGYQTEVRMAAEPAPISGVRLLDGGVGYVQPVVAITDSNGGTGSGATATANIDDKGTVTSITLDTAGTGYHSPVVTITEGTGATLIAHAEANATAGRSEGIPDASLAGPAIVQFASEAGLLPAPVVHEPNPINLNEFGEVVHGGLYLGTAERVDSIIDFSQYAGKTLILYNDSPAPVPGGDPRYDYFTGNDDQTRFGGAPSTLPGYGPNVRTVMQIKVAGAPAAAFNTAAFASRVATRYTAEADPAIVQDTTAVTFDPAANVLAVNGTDVHVQVKTIEGGYDVNFGRLIANFGTEIVDTAAATPLGYIDPPTEILNPDETQYWIIKNHDADNHPIHFHLFNVQVLGRHTGGGAIKAPLDSERGWKETVQSWPGEDLIVALKPKTPVLPFGLANSVRLLDPSLQVGTQTAPLPYTDPTAAPLAFLQYDLVTGAPKTVANGEQDYGWEYVWHCHILGHEENDLMRPMRFNAPSLQPLAATNVTVANGVVSWTDPTPSNQVATYGNAANEYGFRVERAVVTNGVAGSFQALPTTAVLHAPGVNTQANATSIADLQPLTPNTDYQYRVVSVNQPSLSSTGATASAPFVVRTVPALPASLATTTTASTTGALTVKLTWADSSNEAGYRVRRDGVVVGTLAANATNFSESLAKPAVETTHNYQVTAFNNSGEGKPAATTVVHAMSTPRAPTALVQSIARVAANNSATVSLTWADNATNETGYTVSRNGAVIASLPAGSTRYTDTLGTLTAQTATKSLTYLVTATNAMGNSSGVQTIALPGSLLNAPTALSAQYTTTNGPAVSLTWKDEAFAESGYAVQRSSYVANVNTGALAWTPYSRLPLGGSLLPTNAMAFSDSSAAVDNSPMHRYQVLAVNGAANGAIATVNVSTGAVIAAPIGLRSSTATSNSLGITWTASSNGFATGYTLQRCLGTAVACAGPSANWSTVAFITGSRNATYTNQGLSSRKSYSYRVQATNREFPALNSAWSSITELVTK